MGQVIIIMKQLSCHTRFVKTIHEAKMRELPKIEIWGSGKPRREFLHVDDLAQGAIHIMNLSKKSFDKNTTFAITY